MSFSKWLGLAGLRIGALVAAPSLFDELAQTSTSVLGASVVAQRAAQAGLAVKSEWMSKVRRIDRANKAMIHEAASAIEGLAAIFWCWKPSQPASVPKRWSNAIAGRAS